MRLRVPFSAFAVVALVAVNAHTSSEPVATAAAIHPIPAWVRAADARDMAEFDQARAAFFDGLARADAQRAADAQAAMAAAAAQAAQVAADARAAQQATPEPAVAPERAPVSDDGSVAADAIRQYFGDVFDQAWNVSGCESGHDPGAVSSGGANYGLFQINKVHVDDFEKVTNHAFYDGVFDPYLNAQYARHVYDTDGGWSRDWSCAWAARR